jgi:hypothetical protein
MLDHRRLDISIEPQIIDQGMLERLQTPDKKIHISDFMLYMKSLTEA